MENTTVRSIEERYLDLKDAVKWLIAESDKAGCYDELQMTDFEEALEVLRRLTGKNGTTENQQVAGK